MSNCDPKRIVAFDYSKLGNAFDGLSKPAKRALINSGIYSAADLAKWTRAEIAILHGIGPGTLPSLEAVLGDAKLRFSTQ